MFSLPINSGNSQIFHFPCPESDASNDSTSPSSFLSDSSITSASSCASSFASTTTTPIHENSSTTSCSKMLKVATPSMPPTPILSISPTPILACNPKPSNRPKLSLQTSCLPITFGKSTTALSLPPSTTRSRSPTSRNTFSNAFDSYNNNPTAPASSNISSQQQTISRPPRQRSPPRHKGNETSHHRSDVPYQLPKGVRSILRNSPIRETASTPETAVEEPTSISNRTNSTTGLGGRRILIPVKKRVAYRFPLDEEIKTVRFTARHSDLPSPSSSSSSTPNSPSDDAYVYSSLDEDSDSGASSSEGSGLPSQNGSTSNTNSSKNRISPGSRLPKRKNRRGERQIRAAGIRDGLLLPDDEWNKSATNNDDDVCPQTPSHRRQKRLRQWRWTLGPVKDGYVQPISPTGRSSASPPPPPPPPQIQLSQPVPRSR